MASHLFGPLAMCLLWPLLTAQIIPDLCPTEVAGSCEKGGEWRIAVQLLDQGTWPRDLMDSKNWEKPATSLQ